MAETITITVHNKNEKYSQLIPQLTALVIGEPDSTANFANCIAALKEVFDWLWVGIYFVKKNNSGIEQMVLGPFQGPVACTRIDLGRGVCGKSWERAETIIVDDVDQFPGHIACSSLSKSEIVVPLIRDGKVFGVLDIDSDQLSSFNQIDKHQLEILVSYL
mgnify:CR=1 FL=1